MDWDKDAQAPNIWNACHCCDGLITDPYSRWICGTFYQTWIFTSEYRKWPFGISNVGISSIILFFLAFGIDIREKNKSNVMTTTLLIVGGALIGTTALGVAVMDRDERMTTTLTVSLIGFVIMGLGILRAIQQRKVTSKIVHRWICGWSLVMMRQGKNWQNTRFFNKALFHIVDTCFIFTFTFSSSSPAMQPLSWDLRNRERMVPAIQYSSDTWS